MRIALDLDGVITDFNTAFLGLARTMLDLQVPKGYKPRSWDYLTEELGVSHSDVAGLWKAVEHSDFWQRLNPDPTMTDTAFSKLGLLVRLHDVYFLTMRRGPLAKVQTERWLYAHGLHIPTVVVTDRKPLVCQAVRFDWIIEDHLPTLLEVYYACPETRCYLKNQPWNRGVRLTALTVVQSLEEAMDREKRRVM